MSNSGETAEVVHALRCIRDRCPDAHLLAVVGSGDSAVARLAAGKGRALVTGTVEELHGTIPSSSIVVQVRAVPWAQGSPRSVELCHRLTHSIAYCPLP